MKACQCGHKKADHGVMGCLTIIAEGEFKGKYCSCKVQNKDVVEAELPKCECGHWPAQHSSKSDVGCFGKLYLTNTGKYIPCSCSKTAEELGWQSELPKTDPIEAGELPKPEYDLEIAKKWIGEFGKGKKSTTVALSPSAILPMKLDFSLTQYWDDDPWLEKQVIGSNLGAFGTPEQEALGAKAKAFIFLKTKTTGNVINNFPVHELLVQFANMIDQQRTTQMEELVAERVEEEIKRRALAQNRPQRKPGRKFRRDNE